MTEPRDPISTLRASITENNKHDQHTALLALEQTARVIEAGLAWKALRERNISRRYLDAQDRMLAALEPFGTTDSPPDTFVPDPGKFFAALAPTRVARQPADNPGTTDSPATKEPA
jgi:hypothetical protein